MSQAEAVPGAVKLELCSRQRDDNESRLGIRRWKKQLAYRPGAQNQANMQVFSNVSHTEAEDLAKLCTQNNPKVLEERAVHVEVAPRANTPPKPRGWRCHKKKSPSNRVVKGATEVFCWFLCPDPQRGDVIFGYLSLDCRNVLL